MNRKEFINYSATILAGYLAAGHLSLEDRSTRVMTVNGWMPANKMGFTLTHEHVMVDFIGADKINTSRYNADEVFQIALPKLIAVKERGCQTLIECTPAWLGRDPKLLQRLAEATGLNILSNTGYYGAAGEKYLPAHTFTETAAELAQRWIVEWKNGIEGTGIKPGFINRVLINTPYRKHNKN